MAIIKRTRNDKLTYVVMLRDPDAQWYPIKSFHTKIEARNYESDLIALKQRGTRAKTKADRECTMLEYWAQWSNECRSKVSAGWKLSQDQMWRDHVMPILGKMPLIEVKTKHILRVLNAAEIKGLGAQMRIHIFALLHKMFDDAIEIYDYPIPNPAKKKLKPDSPNTVRDFYTPKEAFLFLDHVKDDFYGPPIWIMMLCGLRIGEVQGLQCGSIDPVANTLTISRQWSRKEKRFKPPKNKRVITVPMPVALSEYLSTRARIDQADALACPGPNGEMLSYDTFYGALKRLCKDSKLPELSPHELRHSCSEIWVRSGATQEDLRRLLNHSNAASTKKYMHETPERLTHIAQNLVH